MTDFRFLYPARPSQWAIQPLALPPDVMEVAAALSREKYFAFLDTADTLGGGGPFSILLANPFMTFAAKGDRIHIGTSQHAISLTGNPFDCLADLFQPALIAARDRPPLPFMGGAVGYFAYDLYRFVESYPPPHAADDLNLPDCLLAFYDHALLFEHRTGRWQLAGVFTDPGMEVATPFLHKYADRIYRLLSDRPPREKSPAKTKRQTFRANFTKPEYLRAVEKALAHIYAGDIYQVNLSQRFQTGFACSPFHLFRTLRAVNPARYSAFLQYDDHTVISSSPELFLSTNGSTVETRPIKGTRPRGKNPAADAHLRRELQNSEKDKAELSMIVDLERNDLGRVCEYGSVRVHEHAVIDELPTVFHTVSTVRGALRPGTGPVQLLRAAFPGGSITGCPKIRSIQIIDRLEPTCRHVYTGAIGFIDFTGDLALNIAIRTIITKEQKAWFQAGGGIVADSDPEAEYNETLDKAKAMKQALRQADRPDES